MSHEAGRREQWVSAEGDRRWRWLARQPELGRIRNAQVSAAERRVLQMAGLAAVRHNPILKAFYLRPSAPVCALSPNTRATPSPHVSTIGPGCASASAPRMRCITTCRFLPGLGLRPAASSVAPVLGRNPRPTPQAPAPTSDAALVLLLSHFKPETIPSGFWL
jgi:hypothetical protein